MDNYADLLTKSSMFEQIERQIELEKYRRNIIIYQKDILDDGMTITIEV